MDSKRKPILNREIAGFVILTALLLLGLLSSVLFWRHFEELSAQLEEAAWFALSDNWDQAKTLAADARKTWEDSRKITCIFADHSPMEEIDALFAQLGIYGAAREKAEYSAVCAALSRHMDAMGNAQRLTWWNLL